MLQWYLLLMVATAIAAGASRPEQLFDQQLYQDVLDPGLCKQQLENMHPYEFYDASSRVPQGVLTGSTSSLGEYHQCLQISQQTAVGTIEGKYCMIRWTSDVSVKLPRFTRNSWPILIGWSEINVTRTVQNFMNKYDPSKKFKKDFLIGAENDAWRNFQSGNISMQLALCIPKACSVDDVLGPLTDNPIAPFTYTEQYCRLPDDKPLSGADYSAIVILSIIGLFTILSTGYDLHHTFVLKKDPIKRNKLCTCCSVYTNTTRLFTYTTNPASLHCLDGIRAISTLWIVFGHAYLNYLEIHAKNLLDFLLWYREPRAFWLLSAYVSVDTFFTISGMLLVYTTVNKLTPKKLLLNIHWFYLYRLLRVLPLLALCVLLQASLFFRVTDGPNSWTLAPEVSQCRQDWWITLLHIQNWINPNTMCLTQTWYLAVDMQLHIASPVLLYWVLGGRRTAWTILTVGLVAVLAANTVYSFYGNFSDPLIDINSYNNTLTRAPPFIIGMICGYILSIVRGRKLQIPMTVVAMGYLLSVVVSSYAMYQEYADWSSDLVLDLNRAFVKSLWALSVCWIVFACVCGYAGPINWFLSLPLWKFMARISYAIYIFHYSIMFMHGASLTMPFYYSMENMWFTFASVTAYTVAAAVAACVLVDAPCSTLQKLMMAGFLKTPAKSTSNSNGQHEAPGQKKKDVEKGST